MSDGLSRRAFSRNLGFTGLAAALSSLPRPSVASGARPGSWCVIPGSSTTFDFNLPLLDEQGETERLSLSSFAGSAVWVTFYATWCPPCNDEARDIVTLCTKYRSAGLEVVGVDVRETPETARRFVARHAIDYPIVLDAQGIVFKGIGGRGFPMHVFLNRRGVVTCVAQDALTWDQMDNEVAAALASEMQKAATT